MFDLAKIASTKPADIISLGATEQLISKLDIFNQASGNTIQLGSSVVTQAIKKEPFVQLGESPIGERDTSVVSGNFPSVELTAGEHEAYRVQRLIKENKVMNAAVKEWNKQNWAASGAGQSLQSSLEDSINGLRDVGAQITGFMLEDIRDLAVTCVASAIGSESGLIYADGTKAAPVTKANTNITVLNDLRSTYGDMAGEITTAVMHSKTYNLLYKDVVLNKRGQDIQDAFLKRGGYDDVSGMNIIVVDSPALVSTETISGSSKKVYKILGLRPEAVRVDVDQILLQQEFGSAGHNINTSVKGHYDLGLKLRGFKLGSSVAVPYSLAKLGSEANWTKSFAQDRACAGTAIYHRVD